jgi:S1-C subfamily serine protease
MNIFGELLVLILSSYLAFSNFVAQNLLDLFNQESRPTASLESPQKETEPTNEYKSLESNYRNNHSIPDILLQNPDYQSASIIGSQPTQNVSSKVVDALVNIYCTYTTPEYQRITTGSGFFIDDDGVILTNAHVAQFLLLDDNSQQVDVKCIVRAGSPALAIYEAKLLYISPAWVQANASQILTERPRGTGERDYALLYVHSGLDNKPLPGKFPSLVVNNDYLSKELIGSDITVAGYPADDFTEGSEANLTPVISTTTLTDMFTFDSNYADVIAIEESAVGQFGSSGGPILNEAGEVIGLITTKGSQIDGNTSLRALTISYIDRTIIEETTFDLKSTTGGQLAFRSDLFLKTIAPFLTRILELEL